jgi:transposase
MSTTKKTYTKEFKEEAVRLAKQTGKRSQVARELGIQVSMLRRWQLELEQHQEKAFPGKGKPVDEELVRLQRENQRLKQEVEILKKAMGILGLPILSIGGPPFVLTEIPFYPSTSRTLPVSHALSGNASVQKRLSCLGEQTGK